MPKVKKAIRRNMKTVEPTTSPNPPTTHNHPNAANEEYPLEQVLVEDGMLGTNVSYYPIWTLLTDYYYHDDDYDVDFPCYSSVHLPLDYDDSYWFCVSQEQMFYIYASLKVCFDGT